MIFTSFYAFRDEKDRHVDYRIVVDWLNKNTKFVDAGITSFHVVNGRLFSVCKFSQRSGRSNADILFKALKAGVELNTIPIRAIFTVTAGFKS